MTNTKDEATLKLIQEVQRRNREIADAEKPNWKTNCSLRHSLTGATHNLHVENDLTLLVSLAAQLTLHEEAFDKACLTYALDLGRAKYMGYPIKDWLHDIALRINKIQISSKKLQLESLESRLNSIISPDLRAQMELEAITKEMECFPVTKSTQ